MSEATTDHEKKKAAYHKIRGLRRCQNAECGSGEEVKRSAM